MKTKISKLLCKFHWDNNGLHPNDELLDLYIDQFEKLIQSYADQQTKELKEEIERQRDEIALLLEETERLKGIKLPTDEEIEEYIKTWGAITKTEFEIAFDSTKWMRSLWQESLKTKL
jgi:hypothetical protein